MEYVKARGINYASELHTIDKVGDALQPVYEAFINAWEAIIEKFGSEHLRDGKIDVMFYASGGIYKSGEGGYDFEKITITDNGIGLNDTNYNRLIDLRDCSKAHSNRGTGRVQFLHFFDETTIESVYEASTEHRKRKVTLSKNDNFLKNNAILRDDEDCVVDNTESTTSVTFKTPLDDKDLKFYANASANWLKTHIIRHFLSRFCDNREDMPQISIQRYIDGGLPEEEQISSADIPAPDKQESIKVKYSKLEKKEIIQTEREEEFRLRSFVFFHGELPKNEICMVSKGETASKIQLDCLPADDEINGKHYMFLLSGNYIDESDSDDRGNIRLISRKEFMRQNEDSLFPEEVVLLDDIENETNRKINEMYHEINDMRLEKQKNIDELKEMFLLNPKTVEAIRTKVKTTDTDKDILKKIYESDAEIKAKQDAEIKSHMKEIVDLLPNDEDYQEKLRAKVNEFVRKIPMQNRTALSQYVARRKLVLEIFDMILNRELKNLSNGKRIDEDLLHNLIFQQTSENSSPEYSDLWLINEEYIYFKGTSDRKLADITIEGNNLLKQDSDLNDEELEYKNKCKKDAGNRRPDILLFPDEGKCIIIEFKAPDVNVSEHLNQINRYARLINNLSKEEYNIQTYYGYLIGENIDVDDIQDADPNFKSASTLNYIFRPHLPITGKFGRRDGSLYTEVIKYSDLLERAQQRNRIFIEKLEHGDNL